MPRNFCKNLLKRPTRISLKRAMLGRVSYDDTVYSRCTTGDFVDHELETITTSSDPRISGGIEFRRRNSRGPSTLHRCTFPDGFASRINGDPISCSSRAQQK